MFVPIVTMNGLNTFIMQTVECYFVLKNLWYLSHVPPAVVLPSFQLEQEAFAIIAILKFKAKSIDKIYKFC